jgi:Chalcone isomerase-like
VDGQREPGADVIASLNPAAAPALIQSPEELSGGECVDVKGAAKGTIKGDDFAKAFFSIWLGDPPNPELKSGLLGGACG